MNLLYVFMASYLIKPGTIYLYVNAGRIINDISGPVVSKFLHLMTTVIVKYAKVQNTPGAYQNI